MLADLLVVVATGSSGDGGGSGINSIPGWGQLGAIGVLIALMALGCKKVYADISKQRDDAITYARTVIEKAQERDQRINTEYVPALERNNQALTEVARGQAEVLAYLRRPP